VRRLFWVAAGAAAGIYLARRVQRTAQSLTPQGIAGSFVAAMHDVADAVRDFAAEVRVGMAEREIELRHALGLTEDGTTAPGDARPVDDG
jgi:Family of unknown function (DUF6167)